MRRSLRFCAAYSVFLAAATLLTAESGLLEIALTPVTAWLFVISSVALAVAFDRWFVRRCRLPQRPLFDVKGPDARGERRWWVLAGVLAVAYAFLWIPAYCRMDMSWDGMAYHIPTIHLWAAKGYIHWIEPPPEAGPDWRYLIRAVFNGYPKGLETIAFLLARISNDKLLNAPNLLFLPLAFSASTLIARELGATRAVSVAVALLFILVPTVVGQAASTYVDVAFSSAVMASLALGFVLLRCTIARRAPPLPLVVGSGAALGLALGCKAPGTAFFGLSLGVFAITSLVRFRRRRLKRLFASLAIMSVIGLSVGGIWYFRNWIKAGNPVNPIAVGVAGHVIFRGDDLSKQINEQGLTPPVMQSWSTARKVAYTWRQSGRLEWPIDGIREHDEKGYMIAIPDHDAPAWPRSIRNFDPRSGGLGFLWLFGALPAVIYVGFIAVRRFRRAAGTRMERVRAARALALYVLLLIPVIALFKLMPMPWWARYTLWLYAAGLPALALALTITTRSRVVQIGFGLLLGISFFEYLYAVKWSLTRDHFFGPAHTASIGDAWHNLTTTNDDGRRAMWHESEGLARDALNGDAVLAATPFAAKNETIIGKLTMPIGKRKFIMLDAALGNDPDGASRFVAKYLPRYIIWDHDRYGPPKVFLESATRWEWLGTMMIFEFGEEKTSPPLLTPE